MAHKGRSQCLLQITQILNILELAEGFQNIRPVTVREARRVAVKLRERCSIFVKECRLFETLSSE